MADFIRDDDEFIMKLVTFQVKDTRFIVLVDPFEKRSQVFRDMFALPVASPEGQLDNPPIVLEGVEVADFKALLRFLYQGLNESGSKVRLSQKEWVGVHALAHIWGFEEARKASKALLVDMEDSITKIELAIQYDYDDWLRRAYEELAKRPDPLSEEEGRRIGMDAVLHIAQIREHRLKALSCLGIQKAGVRMHGSGKKQAIYCPQCLRTIGRAWLESCYTCGLCRLTVYGSIERLNQRIDKRVREKVWKLIPPKPEDNQGDGANPDNQ